MNKKITKKKTKEVIENYIKDVPEQQNALLKACEGLLRIKGDYAPFGYLFDFEVGKILHHQLDEDSKSEKYFLAALENISGNDDEILGEIYYCLGGLYSDLKDFSKSNDFYFKCLNIYESISDPEGVEYQERCYINIGSNYEETGGYEKAKEYYKKADGLSTGTGLANYYLASLYAFELEEYDKAIKYGLKANKYLKDKINIVSNLRILRHVFTKKKAFETAESYIKALFKYAPEAITLHEIHEDYGILYCLWRKEKEGIKHFEYALNELNKDDPDYDQRYIYLKTWVAQANAGLRNNDIAESICSDLIEKYDWGEVNLIFPVRVKARILLAKREYQSAYTLLSKNLKIYETSRHFSQDAQDYNMALKIKTEAFKQLPLFNKLLEKSKK